MKPHGDWNYSCFVVHVLWKPQNWAFRVLFTKEDDRKAARWLHSNVKSLYFVTKSNVLWRSRRRSRPSFVRSLMSAREKLEEYWEYLSVPQSILCGNHNLFSTNQAKYISHFRPNLSEHQTFKVRLAPIWPFEGRTAPPPPPPRCRTSRDVGHNFLNQPLVIVCQMVEHKYKIAGVG